MKSALAILALATLGACANYRPVVDTQGVDPARYEADLADCQRYATQVDPGASAAANAAAAAVVGGIIGAIFGNRHDAGRMAAAMGTLGAANGAAAGGQAQITIVRNCMAQRGYRVLY